MEENEKQIKWIKGNKIGHFFRNPGELIAQWAVKNAVIKPC